MDKAPRPVATGLLVVVAVLVGLVFSAGAQAAPGDLDLTFSGDGKQTTDFGGFNDGASGVAIQGDGKIVAAGCAGNEGVGCTREEPEDIDFNFALARYNPNGSLDTSFSGDGRQTTAFLDFGEAFAVAVQGDGKIVAVGYTDIFEQRAQVFAIARYNPNGSLDTSFSGDGRQITDFGGSDASAADVALQGNGKIVVVGRSFVGGSFDYALARYNPNGSLDRSFSGDGRQTTDFGGSDDFGADVALQENGKIVVVGSTGSGVTDAFALARYNPNGSLDTSFSGDGRQTTDFGDSDFALGMALQGNGTIVAAGGTGGNFALARYNPNGSLDTSFSGDGRQTTNFGGSDVASGVVLLDGKIVAVGSGGSGVTGGFALARYNRANGTLDTSFSGDGRQTTNFGGSDGASGAARQGGKIVAVGGGSGPNGTDDFALARYLGG